MAGALEVSPPASKESQDAAKSARKRLRNPNQEERRQSIRLTTVTCSTVSQQEQRAREGDGVVHPLLLP